MTLDRLDPLLARARARDAAALSELLGLLQPRLRRMVELRIDPSLQRRLDPDDVVQEALLAAARRFPEWCAQDAYPFHVWLRLLAAQCLTEAQRTHLGAQRRDARREVGLGADRPSVSALNAAEFIVASQTSPTQAVRRTELRECVLAALEDLEPLDREILALRHFEELSNEDAAAELGVEPAAASKRYVRALQRMRPALESLGPGAPRTPGSPEAPGNRPGGP